MFKIGVVAPYIQNHNFAKPAVIQTTLNGVYPGATPTTITIDQPSGYPDAEHIFGGPTFSSTWEPNKFNKVVLGPSTVSGYEGTVEEMWIASASGNDITLLDSNDLSGHYADEDPVTLYTTTLPDGWTFDSTDTYFSDMLYYIGGDIQPQTFTSAIKTSGTSIASYMAQLNLREPFLGNQDYVFACKYIYAGTQNPIEIKLYENGTSTLLATMVTNQGSGSWYLDTETFTTAAAQSSAGTIRIYSQTTSQRAVALESMYLLCAPYNGNNGQYTFTEEASGVTVKNVRKRKSNMSIDGYKINYINDNNILYNQKRVLVCNFPHVISGNDNLFQALTRYDAFQSRGYLIGLQTNLEGLPPIMVGKFTINSITSHLYNTGNRSFSFQFEEVV